jgi:carboxypeptidase C (cathepsin A)
MSIEFFGELLGEDLSFYTETGYVKFVGDGSIFYHLILQEGTKELDDIKASDTIAIWLNGGPGSSS